MPFCTQCGSQVQPSDVFCGTCGQRQGTGPSESTTGAGPSAYSRPPRHNDFLGNMTERNASLFCYIPMVGWIMSIVVLAAEKFREIRQVRFHAFQGLYLFVLWLFVDWVFGPLSSFTESTRIIGKLMKAVVFGTWIFMLVKTGQGVNFRLPILGELADRSVSEQR